CGCRGCRGPPLGGGAWGAPARVARDTAGLDEPVPRVDPAAPAVLRDQVLVGERRLGIVVPPAVPGVAGHRVEVPPVLLDVLPVVAFRAGQPERPLLEDRIPAVPQRQAQAQALLDVAEPGQAILAPPVGAGPGVVVRQVGPGLAVGAVVLADGPPLALAQVRAPLVPGPGLAEPVFEPPEPRDALTFLSHPSLPSPHASR